MQFFRHSIANFSLLRSVNFGTNCVLFGNLQSNNFVEGVSHKIRRQIEELERVSGVESSALTVDGVPVDSYLTRYWITVHFNEIKYGLRMFGCGSWVISVIGYWILGFCYDGRFVWDEAKYPTMSPLKEVVDSIHGQVAKIEDDLKVILHPFFF